MTCIGTFEGFAYLIAAFLILVIVLGIGVLLGYFLLRSADKHHLPVPPPSQQGRGRAPHTRGTTTSGRDRHAR